MNLLQAAATIPEMVTGHDRDRWIAALSSDGASQVYPGKCESAYCRDSAVTDGTNGTGGRWCSAHYLSSAKRRQRVKL